MRRNEDESLHSSVDLEFFRLTRKKLGHGCQQQQRARTELNYFAAQLCYYIYFIHCNELHWTGQDIFLVGTLLKNPLQGPLLQLGLVALYSSNLQQLQQFCNAIAPLAWTKRTGDLRKQCWHCYVLD